MFCLCAHLSEGADGMQRDSLFEFRMCQDVSVTIDVPRNYDASKETMLIFYALANGNSTVHTMGNTRDTLYSWSLNIQHIGPQTKFIRRKLRGQNIVVAYLENDFKSWPLWKTKHANFISDVQNIVDTISNLFESASTTICLNGHSGGGRFIFAFLDGVNKIPNYVKRIVFLDSDYGYENSYGSKIINWLQENKNACLQVFAYDDSQVELNGKRIVSDTGGTWYRSHQMLKDLSAVIKFRIVKDDSIQIYKSENDRIAFYFKKNPGKEIFHSKQVELNGFIQSILAGTKKESENYKYYGERAYEELMRPD